MVISQHILVYSDDPGIGGSARYDHSILCGLAASGYQVSYVNSLISNPMITCQKELGIQHWWLDFNTVNEFGRTLTNPSDAQRILSSAKPDIVVFSDACPLSNFAAKQVAIKLRIPYITVVGFAAPYLAERFTDYLDEVAHHYEQAKFVLAIASETLNLLHELFRLPKDKGEVIYWGRPSEYFETPKAATRQRLRQEFDIPLNAVVCFTAARLDPRKGFEYQIEAIKQLHQSSVWSKLYFVWAGFGALETQLRETVKELGVDTQVKILGQRWDISDWMDAADIFILPSLLESLGLAIIEAMAKGLPVIASAVGGIPEVLGDTGKLLPDPKIDSQGTVRELVKTVSAWCANSKLRRSIGQSCKKRAENMFREEQMVTNTIEVIERALLPIRDYVSPGLSIIMPDKCFPNMIVADPKTCPWPYQRQGIPHNWYVDRRFPDVGFQNRDEAHILYNTALKFKGKRALEIGCFMGWSTCHLALGGVELDVIDPLLGRADFYESVSNSLQCAGVLNSVNLIAGFSPQKVEELATQLQRRWALIFIDGEHAAPGPIQDAIVANKVAEADAIVLFHDLPSPDVAQGLDYLRQNGWNTMVYQTMQIMGVAWRGNVEPVKHIPDPKVKWHLPEHIKHYSVSGISPQFLTGLSSYVEQYQKDSSEQSVLADLRQTRKNIAELWLNTADVLLESVYLSDIGKGHQLILGSGICNQPLTKSEQTFVGDLVTIISSKGFDNPKAIQCVLAGMLYVNAYHLCLPHDLPRIPHWLLNDYLKFILNCRPYFQEIGEADSYCQYMQEIVNYLHISIFTNPTSDLWRNVASQFLQITYLIPIYFNEVNLKDLYIKRSEIIELALKEEGREIDWEFADNSLTRKKIRLGILASHFMPAAETFASLPVYEYINRDFEVILYSLISYGHPLEEYCQSCANSFKLLPNNLTEQVNLIREDDLDILFIATNVTAVTNQIYLLALHRMARIQVTSVASVVTTGIRNIDYYISGNLTESFEDAEQHYQEELLKLDGSAHCFSYGNEPNLPSTKVNRESIGIAEDAVVFISGANLFKIIPELRNTWAKIVAAVPNSVLVLYPFGPNWSTSYPKQVFIESLNAAFLQYGADPDSLLILDPIPVPNRNDIKEYLKLADIYLDSYPFSGTTSVIDPLEVALPAVARQGSCFRSAMGVALLQQLGIRDLVADSEESYIQLAIALGINLELRQQISDRIEQNMQGNPGFLDSRSYSAKVGFLFQEIFLKYQTNAIAKQLNLRELNFIIFPDWNQSEDLLLQDLGNVIQYLATHPDKSKITLLVDSSSFSDEDANLALSSVAMNLLMEEDLDVSDGPEISLIAQLSEIQWSVLMHRLYGRIVLENENREAIAQAKTENIPTFELDNFTRYSIAENS
jgi:predicted O-linked N-acetylglucosamine transferase (SPINDLY family)/glycosyltransferase involved in cell wall biosynthesis